MSTSEPTTSQKQSLDKLFQPSSVAMVGVSRREDSLGRRALRHLIHHGFTGDLAVIHPSADEIGGVKAYPSLGDLENTPDLVFVCTHGDVAVDVIEDAVEVGAPAVAVIAASGTVIESKDRVRAALARTGTRLLGPNGPGYVSVKPSVAAHISHFLTQNESIPEAPIGLITQSGAVGGIISNHLIEARVGFNWLLCTGNEFDLGLGEALEFLAEQDLRAIGLFVEAIRDPENFRRGLDKAAERGIKVCALKVGGTEAGQRQALTHTGALTGMNELFVQELTSRGGTVCSDLEQLAAYVAVATLPRPTRRSMAVSSASGGFSGILADRVAERDIAVPELDGYINPWDTNAIILEEPDGVGRTMTEMLAKDEIGGGIFGFPAMPDRVLNGFAEGIAGAEIDKPLVIVPATGFTDEARELIRGKAVAIPWTGPAVDAMDWWLSQAPPHAGEKSDRGPGFVDVDESAAKERLRLIGVATPSSKAVSSLEEAIEFAADGGTWVLKCLRPAFAHKKAVGAMAVGVTGDADSIRRAWSTIADSVQKASGEPMTQLLIEEQIEPGLELLVSTGHDPQYGGYLTVGAGGSNVEQTADVAHRLLPADRDDIEAALAELKIAGALRQAADRRGESGTAPTELIDLIDTVVRHATEQAGVTIEINPVILPFAGGSPVAVDCLYIEPDGE